MAIQTVRVQIQGTWYTATYNGGTGKYDVNIPAPSVTSFNQPGQHYPVTVDATNTAGTTATATTADPTVGNSLKLVVRERVLPVITIITPTASARTTNNLQPVVFDIVDEISGSGIKLDSITLYIDGGAGIAYNAAGMSNSPITNGYRFTYNPQSALGDGSHTIAVNGQDNDGNIATQKTVTFTVDTVAPSLSVTSPADGLITNNSAVTIAGVTNDATSSPVVVTATNNGADVGAFTVDGGGNFSKGITLVNGTNTIVVTATDAAGKTTTVTRTITLDVSAPVISAVVLTPNPADAGATVIATVTVSG